MGKDYREIIKFTQTLRGPSDLVGKGVYGNEYLSDPHLPGKNLCIRVRIQMYNIYLNF